MELACQWVCLNDKPPLYSNQSKIELIVDSPYRDEINEALLKLKEGRRVHNLTEKWWKEKNVKKDGKKCETETEEESDTPDLDIAHVKGVFLVLLIGIGLAVLIGVLEFCWNVRKVSISQKVNIAFNKSISKLKWSR